jgi:hypothetical protein
MEHVAHHQVGAPESLNRMAVRATLHCLTGCAIGEVLGMVIATALGWGNTASIAASVVLAFFFGYALTFGPILQAGVPARRAVGLTIGSDTISIATMEVVDNAFILVIPGAMAAGLPDGLFWWSLITSLVIALFVTVPVNRWLIAWPRSRHRAPAPLARHRQWRHLKSKAMANAGHVSSASQTARTGPDLWRPIRRAAWTLQIYGDLPRPIDRHPS